MADEAARDSGICEMDNENYDSFSTSLSTSSSYHDFNQLSYVQRLRKRFECLAKEQEKEFHAECNWWLEDNQEDAVESEVFSAKNDNEVKIHDVKNKVLVRNVSAESEKQTYTKQSSIKSQISHESAGKVTPATTEKTISMPLVTFTDYKGKNETNDSDSFDSDSDEDHDVENDQVRDEVEEELPEEYVRNSRQSLKLLRPISITSQTSK